MKSYRHIFVALAIALLMAWWLSKRLDISSLFCLRCWKERLLAAKLLIFRTWICGGSCVSNLRSIAVAILDHYVPKHNGYLPDEEGWKQWVIEFCKNTQILRCPDAKPSQEVCYRMNPMLSGKRLSEVVTHERTILIFECDEYGNPVVRHHFLHFRHCCYVLFADGRIGHLKPAQVKEWIWGK